MIEDVLFFACESGHVRCRWKIRFYSWYEISLEITKFVGNQYRRIWYIFQRWSDQLNISRIANFIRPTSSSNTNWFPDIRDTMRNIFPNISSNINSFMLHFPYVQVFYCSTCLLIRSMIVCLSTKVSESIFTIGFLLLRKRIELSFSNIIVDNNSDW